ncbi:Alpha/Beta hydrolase protein [Armillaria novae-zelandiae]|uniref:Alpha/Beta hydrolase protein n=1 Tax=Armillaria novae-zelandiae TaxID=153914 RepID=A0AA39NTN3_9AGAR|nr:Alpha/Beta hydrolase protein [Armillaria novae-zelandiae]
MLLVIAIMFQYSAGLLQDLIKFKFKYHVAHRASHNMPTLQGADSDLMKVIHRSQVSVCELVEICANAERQLQSGWCGWRTFGFLDVLGTILNIIVTSKNAFPSSMMAYWDIDLNVMVDNILLRSLARFLKQTFIQYEDLTLNDGTTMPPGSEAKYHMASQAVVMANFSDLVPSKDGALIYADAAGDPTKPCLVFVHGFTLSGAVFDNLFTNPKLIANFYLVRYDTRGHGRSTMPDSLDHYSSEIFAEDFKAVMHAFKIEKPIYVGWSLGGTRHISPSMYPSFSCTHLGIIVCDIAMHLPKDTLAGVVYLAALPFIGPLMDRVVSPLVLGFLPDLFRTDDVNLNAKTTIDFVDSLFADPKTVPFSLKTSWYGTALLQPPQVCKNVVSRPQDPEKLYELAKEGLPLLALSGTADQQVQGDVVVEEMRPYYKNMDVHTVEGGSHALFYDNEAEVVDSISTFASKVFAGR